MGIFDSIKSAIFGSAKASEAASASAVPAGASTAAAATAETRQATATGTGPSAASAMSQVDVEAVLGGLAAKNAQKLDWRKSIVDMMKLLDLDSSLSARKGAREGTALFGRRQRFRDDEHVAAQAGHDQARGQ